MRKAHSSVLYIKHFGRNLRRLRQTRGYTVTALAIESGLGRGLLTRLEGDDPSNPTLDTLLRLQRALKLSSLELLLQGEEEFASRRLLTEVTPSPKS